MHHFIFTLGSEFEPIQNNYLIGNLPDARKITSWPALLILCLDFYNSINPGGLLSCNTKSDITPDCAFHQKKIKNWFLQPIKFCKEIEAEQQRHPRKCIYHLTKSHPTESCSTIKGLQKPTSTKRIQSLLHLLLVVQVLVTFVISNRKFLNMLFLDL
jgi:hypothetical protein